MSQKTAHTAVASLLSNLERAPPSKTTYTQPATNQCSRPENTSRNQYSHCRKPSSRPASIEVAHRASYLTELSGEKNEAWPQDSCQLDILGFDLSFRKAWCVSSLPLSGQICRYQPNLRLAWSHQHHFWGYVSAAKLGLHSVSKWQLVPTKAATVKHD